jgi:act minimal PKS acyl carrier protein
MRQQEMALEDLTRILEATAGADEQVDLDGDILDVDFTELGYDSIAVMETASRIERELGVTLNETAVLSATTPRAFLAMVNKSVAPAV